MKKLILFVPLLLCSCGSVLIRRHALVSDNDISDIRIVNTRQINSMPISFENMPIWCGSFRIRRHFCFSMRDYHSQDMNVDMVNKFISMYNYVHGTNFNAMMDVKLVLRERLRYIVYTPNMSLLTISGTLVEFE